MTGTSSMVFKKAAIARRSGSVKYWVLPSTTSAIGPATDACGDTPLCSSATTSSVGHCRTPASCASVSAGAYQFCTGISPPASPRPLAVAPKALRAPWQALQWPSPLTR